MGDPAEDRHAPGPAPPALPPTADAWVHRQPSEPLPAASRAQASVLVVLRDGPHGTEVLLVQRTVRAADPASGQVALPGGHVQPSDGSLRSAALRECEEEVGLSREDLAEDPRLASIAPAPAFGLDVAVFVASLGSHSREPRVASPEEVASVFWLPRSALEDRVRVRQETQSGLWEVDAALYDGHVLWGFTLRELLRFFGLPASRPETRWPPAGGR